MPEDMPEDISGRMSEDMPDRMSEGILDRIPEDLPISKYINFMVKITRNKIILNYIIFYWKYYKDIK